MYLRLISFTFCLTVFLPSSLGFFPYFCLFICVFIFRLSTCPFICLSKSVWLSTCLSVCICLSVHLPLCVSVSLSVCLGLPTCLPAYVSMYMPVQSICLYLCSSNCLICLWIFLSVYVICPSKPSMYLSIYLSLCSFYSAV